MGEPKPNSVPNGFADAFRSAAGNGLTLRFDQFMQLALYHPTEGYYRKARPRVGRSPQTDFYTSSSSAPLFGDLVAAACTSLLEGRPASRYRFVELGAEPGSGVLKGVDHPFADAVALGVGDALHLEGPCVVFSNELFDAQPFRRLVKRRGAWQEVHVQLTGETTLMEIEVGADPADFLPEASVDGFRIDAPLAAEALAAEIAAQAWHGVFVAFDYGKSWDQLTSVTPQGTARAYRHHHQHNNLLAHPGDQDLTCHVCWDWLARALTHHGFRPPQLESQEAFFIRHASRRIEVLMNNMARQGGAQARGLTQLLHPAYLGQKFEVLHASRFAAQDCP
jgi:SAM-dependent MidA family methyltransferase